MSAEGMQATVIATMLKSALARDKLEGYDFSTGRFGPNAEQLIRDLAAQTTAPTQGADARPVAIYQVYWGETASWTDTTPETFALVDARYRRIVYATRDADSAAIQELQNIVKAKRFDYKIFEDDTAFADWVQSRARACIAAISPRNET